MGFDKIEPLNSTSYINPTFTQKVVHEQTNADGVHSQTVKIEEATLIDEVNADLVYVGYGNLGEDTSLPKFKIKRIRKTGNVTRVQYADGNLLYDNIWDNRGSLNYL